MAGMHVHMRVCVFHWACNGMLRQRARTLPALASGDGVQGRRPKEPTIQAESSAKIQTNLLASEAASACLSSPTRLSSMQSIGRDASIGRNPLTRGGSVTLPAVHGIAGVTAASRGPSRSLSSDHGSAAPDGAAAAGAALEIKPLSGWARDAADLAAAEAAAAASALCSHMHVRSGPASDRSWQAATTTTTNAVFEPEPWPPPGLQSHRQGSHGSHASWAAVPFTPELPPPPPPRPRAAAEFGFPRGPAAAAAGAGAGVSAESGATPVTGLGVGDSSYDVSVRTTLPPHADLRARLDFIEYQLDAFGAGSAILGEFVMPGPAPGTRFKGGA